MNNAKFTKTYGNTSIASEFFGDHVFSIPDSIVDSETEDFNLIKERIEDMNSEVITKFFKAVEPAEGFETSRYWEAYRIGIMLMSDIVDPDTSDFKDFDSKDALSYLLMDMFVSESIDEKFVKETFECITRIGGEVGK